MTKRINKLLKANNIRFVDHLMGIEITFNADGTECYLTATEFQSIFQSDKNTATLVNKLENPAEFVKSNIGILKLDLPRELLLRAAMDGLR